MKSKKLSKESDIMQQAYSNHLNITLPTLTVNLPADKIIIDFEEYKKLKEQVEIGHYLKLEEVLKMLSVSRPWFLENVLHHPKIRSEIDIDKNPNGFVKYPNNQGGRYYFLATKTREYFEKNFADIFK